MLSSFKTPFREVINHYKMNTEPSNIHVSNTSTSSAINASSHKKESGVGHQLEEVAVNFY